MNAVILNEITKTYGKERQLAVDRVSFRVEQGELFGLIGPDGAGKTSIFRILTTLLLADSGTAAVDGFDVVKDFKEIRARVGYMPGRFSLYQDLSVEENLNFFATVFGTTIKENYDIIKDIYVQIEPFKKRLAGKLSGGMKQKLALCCALIHKPSVLFLDEPTTGVDPVSRKEFWEMLKRLKEQGITIIASTPYMDEAELCDRIALIHNGNLLSVDTPRAIIDSYPDQLFSITYKDLYSLIRSLEHYPGTSGAHTFGESVHMALNDTNGDTVTGIYTYLHEKGFSDARVARIEPSVEDCFIRLLSTNDNNSDS